MAKARQQRKKPALSTPAKSPERKGSGATTIVAILGCVGTLVGTFGGMVLQDHLDILKTHRELAMEYSAAAEASEKTVEQIIRTLITQLGNPLAEISTEEWASLRSALLNLRGDVENLTIQVGSSETPYESYTRAMADLADAVDEINGAGDADIFIEALDDFYLSQRKFKVNIASVHRPSAT